MGRRSPEIDEYISAASPRQRDALVALRELIHEVHPQIDESIEFTMPTFTLGGAMVAGLAAEADSLCLYCSPGVVEIHRDELRGLAPEEGRIRFHRLDQLPLETIRSIVLESKPAR